MNINVVADPMLMDNTGIVIGGVQSNRVFEDAVDFDATSLYPSIWLAFHVDAEGQVGRVMLVDADGNLTEGTDLIEAMACGDMVEIGRRLLNLPGMDTLLAEVLES